MARQWNMKQESVTETSWLRSFQQIFQTGLGTDFSVVILREQVVIQQDGKVRHEPMPSVVRKMSRVGADPRVQQLAAILTELAEEWGLEDDAVADVEPEA